MAWRRLPLLVPAVALLALGVWAGLVRIGWQLPQGRLDLVTYHVSDHRWRERQFDDYDLREQGMWWNEHLTQLANAMPDGEWLDGLLT